MTLLLYIIVTTPPFVDLF